MVPPMKFCTSFTVKFSVYHVHVYIINKYQNIRYVFWLYNKSNLNSQNKPYLYFTCICHDLYKENDSFVRPKYKEGTYEKI